MHPLLCPLDALLSYRGLTTPHQCGQKQVLKTIKDTVSAIWYGLGLTLCYVTTDATSNVTHYSVYKQTTARSLLVRFANEIENLIKIFRICDVKLFA